MVSIGIFYWAAVALPAGSAVSSRGKERLLIMASFASALGQGMRDLCGSHFSPLSVWFEIASFCAGGEGPEGR